MMTNNQTFHDFIRVVTAALFYVNEHKAVLAKALAWPFAAFLVVDLAAYLDLSAGFYLFLSIISWALHVVFAITTHRLVLLGPDSVSRWGLTSWTRRETLFLLHAVGLGLLSIPVALLVFIPLVGFIAAVIIFCWLAGRLSLVFPGIAVDKGVTFTLSWELTGNYQLLMFLVVIAYPILLAVPTVVTSLLSSLISTVVIVFEVATLSFVYQHITSAVYDDGLPGMAEGESP